ncbi:MAG: hypothetical protein K9L86_02340 [Candidatus Omnitrophica bacterium]|nr:hypothetical protein [Candidatus Omnitrophota bacterium]
MESYAMLMKAVGLVIVSFFVLLGASKTDSENLKKFGRVLAITIWLLALSSVVGALFNTIAEKKYEKYVISSYKDEFVGKMKQRGSCNRKRMEQNNW